MNITGGLSWSSKSSILPFLPVSLSSSSPSIFCFSTVGRGGANVGAQTDPSSRGGEREGERLTARTKQRETEIVREKVSKGLMSEEVTSNRKRLALTEGDKAHKERERDFHIFWIQCWILIIIIIAWLWSVLLEGIITLYCQKCRLGRRFGEITSEDAVFEMSFLSASLSCVKWKGQSCWIWLLETLHPKCTEAHNAKRLLKELPNKTALTDSSYGALRRKHFYPINGKIVIC